MTHPVLPPRRAAALVVAGVAALQLLMVLAFTWPATRTEPRDVPVGVAAPPAAAEAFRASVERAHPGAFAVSRVEDGAALRAAIRSRDVYGGVVLDEQGAEVLVATAASPTVAAMLAGLAPAPASTGGAEPPVADTARAPVPVTDVVATSEHDPRGGVLSAGLLPIVMTSVVAGALLALLVPTVRIRLVGVVALASVGGAGVVGIGHGLLGGLQGNVLPEIGVVALLIIAVAATVAAAGSLFGHAGIPPVAIVMMLLGNPLSGAASAPEMLPHPWGELGQLLPPGAGSQALRSVAFFDGADAAHPVLVLVTWSVAALLLLGLAAKRQTRPAADAAGEPNADRELAAAAA